MTGYESIPRFHEVYDQVPELFRAQFLLLLDQVPEEQLEAVLKYVLVMADAVKEGNPAAFTAAFVLVGAPVELAPLMYQTFREVYLSDHHD